MCSLPILKITIFGLFRDCRSPRLSGEKLASLPVSFSWIGGVFGQNPENDSKSRKFWSTISCFSSLISLLKLNHSWASWRNFRSVNFSIWKSFSSIFRFYFWSPHSFEFLHSNVGFYNDEMEAKIVKIGNLRGVFTSHFDRKCVIWKYFIFIFWTGFA